MDPCCETLATELREEVVRLRTPNQIQRRYQLSIDWLIKLVNFEVRKVIILGYAHSLLRNVGEFAIDFEHTHAWSNYNW
jgi:hypothetical protein